MGWHGWSRIPLVSNIVIMCKDIVPYVVWDDPKQSAWVYMYHYMPLHLGLVDISLGLYEPMEAMRWYHKLVNDCISRVGMAVIHGILVPMEKKNIVGEFFFYICHLNRCHSAIKFKKCLIASKLSVYDTVPCILHMHNLIIGKVPVMAFIFISGRNNYLKQQELPSKDGE
jgi:hypothetical protein